MLGRTLWRDRKHRFIEPFVGNMGDAIESEIVSTKQKRIAELARIHPKLSFTSLAHHIDLRWLYEAYKRTRKDGAVEVDEQTAVRVLQELRRKTS